MWALLHAAVRGCIDGIKVYAAVRECAWVNCCEGNFAMAGQACHLSRLFRCSLFNGVFQVNYNYA